MKSKKIIITSLVTLMCFIFAITLSGCGKNNNNPYKPFVGNFTSVWVETQWNDTDPVVLKLSIQADKNVVLERYLDGEKTWTKNGFWVGVNSNGSYEIICFMDASDISSTPSRRSAFSFTKTSDGRFVAVQGTENAALQIGFIALFSKN